VLTLIEFLRKLPGAPGHPAHGKGTLTAAETENLGLAIMRMEETITTLAAQFDILPRS